MACDKSSNCSINQDSDQSKSLNKSLDIANKDKADDFLSMLPTATAADIADFTDKTFTKFNDLFNMGSSYADKFESEFFDRWRDFGPSILRNPRAAASAFSPSEVPEGFTVIDSTFQTPSFRRYSRCLDADGVSAWDRQGVWNCLIPDHPSIVKSLGLEPGRSTKPEERSWFKDYTVYLDWKRAMYKAMDEKRQKERERERQSRGSSDWFGGGGGGATSDADPSGVFISDEQAEREGKKPYATKYISNDFTDENGQLNKRTVVKKFYPDGTKSVTETVEVNGQVVDSSSKSSGDKSGWFWK